ncbi:hypothetical protein [Barnesiella intestinihominis]
MSFAPLLPNGRRLKIEKRRELSVYLLRGIAKRPYGNKQPTPRHADISATPCRGGYRQA